MILLVTRSLVTHMHDNEASTPSTIYNHVHEYYTHSNRCFYSIHLHLGAISHVHSDRWGMGDGTTSRSPWAYSLWAWSDSPCISGHDLRALGYGLWKFKICFSWGTAGDISLCLYYWAINQTPWGTVSKIKWNNLSVNYIIIFPLYILTYHHIAIFGEFYLHFLQRHFIPNMFICQHLMMLHLQRSSGTPNSGHFLRM